MMSPLIAYVLLMLLAMFWIARDAETIFIFDVFGRNFRYVWFESGQRWTHVFTYGWRLAVVCLLVLFMGFLSYCVYAAAAQFTLFAVLLAASCSPIPWIYLAHRLRWQRYLLATAQRLADFVEGAASEADIARTLDHAAYNTDVPWTAWHPKLDEWKSNNAWDGLIPIVYLRNAPHQSALFTIDWETFLAWNIPADCV